MGTPINDRPLLLKSNDRNLSDFTDDQIWDALETHGTVLFRGFGVDADGFYAFASRFNTGFLTSPFDDRKAASDRNELQTVTLGQAGLSLHFEYGNIPLRPDLLWFYCRKPAAEGTGGETLITDGSTVFDKLGPSTQQALKERRIRYRNYLPRRAMDAILMENQQVKTLVGQDVLGALQESCDFNVVEQTESRVVFECIAPAVTPIGNDGGMKICQNIFTDAYKRPSDQDADSSFSTLVTWEDGSEIAEDILLDLKNSAKASTRGIRWQQGDFVLIDNNRILHGRNQTSDPERDVVMLSSFSVRHPYMAARGAQRN